MSELRLDLTSGVSAIVALVAEHDAQAIHDRKDTIGNLDPSEIDTYNADRDRRDSFATTAWLTGGAAIIAAGVGLVLYRFDDPSDSRLEPMVSTSGGGARVSGRF